MRFHAAVNAAVNGYVIGRIGGGVLLIALIFNAMQLSDMNRRKAPERAEKMARDAERRKYATPASELPSTLEEATAAQEAIMQKWDKCDEDLQSKLGLSEFEAMTATNEQILEACGF
ncbi:MAG: hypothetical protein HC800_18595 [Phormidesmis sp. RL_2_1]|nr:hypothetical protein [Phormidesmis sp. RL_2_1]